MDYHHHTHHQDDDDYDYLVRKIIIPIKFPDSVAKIAGGRSVYMREGSLLNISCTIQGQVNIVLMFKASLSLERIIVKTQKIAKYSTETNIITYIIVR